MFFVGDIHKRKLVGHFFPDLFAADIHKRRQMGKRNALSAVLIRSHLRDNLRGDIARRGKAVRFLDQRTGNHRAVLQHVFKIYKIAVMHVLREIIGVVEVNDAFVVRGYNIFGQQNTPR